MADDCTVLDIVIDDAVAVSVVDETAVDITGVTDDVFAVVTVEGPAGVPGAPGPAFDGTAWWYGEGPPGVIVGSKVGDAYMDLLTGTIYTLD
jgi:hypothetical protein